MKMTSWRPSGRKSNEMRKISLKSGVAKYAEGTCLAKFGNTEVLCTATIEDRVPQWLKGTGSGWITAEYGMLPRSTHTRTTREASRGKQSGRTQEIQRLIGRSLRASTDLRSLGERQIRLDCDVLQADGGTRTAAITGAYVALYSSCQGLLKNDALEKLPIHETVAAVSCGLYNGEAILDLDYEEDSNAQADANFVLTASGQIIEIQGTAEGKSFSRNQFINLLDLARLGTKIIFQSQKAALKIK